LQADQGSVLIMDTNLAGDDTIIDCPQCGIKNPIESDICYSCGAPLHEAPAAKVSRTWIPIVVFILFIVGVLFFYYRLNDTGPSPSKAKTLPVGQPASIPLETDLPVEDLFPEQPAEIQPDVEPLILPVGRVQIKDIAGKLISEIAVPLVGGGWVALPTRAVLGGYQWMLQVGSASPLEIQGGIIGDQDKVGLWRIPEDQILESPDLYPWSPGKPLAWLALGSQDPPEPIEIEVVSRQGNFITVSIPGGAIEPGAFIQDDRVVGWTFGDPIGAAFLWTGDEGRSLKVEIRVDDYYRLTFGNSREEEFVLALALGDDYTTLDRLEAFARAFRFDTRLTADQTPDYLKPEAVISQVRLLLARAVQEGFAVQAAGLFDAEVLARADDVPLLSDVVNLTAQSYGFEEAVNLTENVIESGQPKNDAEKSRLAELHSGLYKNWLNALLEGDNFQKAWQVYERGALQLPDDLNIYLFGVKLALAENDWARAEELLAAKDYPAALRDQVSALQKQIAELKGQQGKIAIRFEPGSRQIPVSASLNQGTPQDFIVDTGASMVTIPYSTAAELGIIITVRNPRRQVFTAGGTLYAPEVVLDSITLEGFETRNVKALVIDLPEHPDLGLLGLNYLSRFRMDLNANEGVLSLTPK
jgi:clan AA aspartic protease (TIGR02281 family)